VSGERTLPGQASLRYLKVEAKRRRAAGEFATLHEAQLAIAREHGHPSWAALRETVAAAAAGSEGHALAQARWVTARFGGAGEPGWTAPGEGELRAHFTGQFLDAVPPERLVALLTGFAGELRGELTVIVDAPFMMRGTLSGHEVLATAEPRPPYRLSGLTARRLGERIRDPRTASPPAQAAGPVPGPVREAAAAGFARLGVAGLALAGATRPGASGGQGAPAAWSAATGWADLEHGKPLRPGHAFPAYHVTMVVTATAVLCLAAGGQVRLDAAANRYLATVKLADDAVTVRELLAHAAGATDPRPAAGATWGHFAPAVPALADAAGPVLACAGRRGQCAPAHAGYAALGELIAAVAGQPYPEAAGRLVLAPLGMRDSWFPERRPQAQAGDRPEPVTGYEVAEDGTFTPAPALVSVFPAAAGMWTTAADLVRLGLGWSSLLPPPLAAAALRPHATQPAGTPSGLGWMVNLPAGVAGIFGAGPGGSASLLVTLDGSLASAALASSQAFLEPANVAVLTALGASAEVS
jgi:CubicO group peptidase (beta-lactamase class C family)